MSAPSSFSWTDLFSAKVPSNVTLNLRVLNKGGEPFLILPDARRLAAKSLSLYPAQRGKAKFAKKMLGVALSAGVPLPFNRVTVQISTQDPFVRFLMQVVGGKADAIPPFAILAGNPGAEGRRFLVLLFDEQGKPVFVAKAGISDTARRLIESESSFLQEVKGRPGMPKMCGSFVSEHVKALALEYVEGESPTREDRQVIAKLMGGWLDLERTVCLNDVPAWKVLEKTIGAKAAEHLICQTGERADFRFHPTLFHGDFAPWNIKVLGRAGAWVVIDWERGEQVGFPAWDWFHYVIQSAILVERLDEGRAFRRVESLLADPIFRRYAGRAGINGKEKMLVSLYLAHLVHVIKPGEGIETARAMLPFFVK